MTRALLPIRRPLAQVLCLVLVVFTASSAVYAGKGIDPQCPMQELLRTPEQAQATPPDADHSCCTAPEPEASAPDSDSRGSCHEPGAPGGCCCPFVTPVSPMPELAPVLFGMPDIALNAPEPVMHDLLAPSRLVIPPTV